MKKIIRLTEKQLVKIVKSYTLNEQLEEFSESTESTRTEFTEKEIEGITLIVKSLSKRYKFIKGWEFNEKYKKYKTFTLINIIIDLKGVLEQYPDVEISDFWFKNGTDSITFVPFTNNIEQNEKFFDISKNVIKNVNMIYSKLPKEYIKYYEFKYDNVTTEAISKIDINSYKTEPTGDTYYEV